MKTNISKSHIVLLVALFFSHCEEFPPKNPECVSGTYIKDFSGLGFTSQHEFIYYKDLSDKYPDLTEKINEYVRDGWHGLVIDKTYFKNSGKKNATFGVWKLLDKKSNINGIELARLEVEYFSSNNPSTNRASTDVFGKKMYWSLGREQNYNQPCLVISGELYLKK